MAFTSAPPPLPAQAAPVLFRELPCADGSVIGVATLNAGSTLNALSLDMIALLHRQLLAWEADPAVALVLLEGSGDKAFCAGGDLQQLYRSMRAHHQSPQRDEALGNAYALEFFTQEYTLDYLIHTCPKPILCWGHGFVMGGGIGLMAGASHRVVTEGSRLAMPEVAIGLYPDVGGSWFLNRMPGGTGVFLALTGAALNACDAQFAGLADYRLPHAGKAALLATLQAQHWRGGDQTAHARLSDVLAAGQRAALASLPESNAPPSPLRQHFDLIEELCAGSLAQTCERIVALQSEDKWLQKAAAALRKGSPGAAWLAYTVQQRARHLSLLEVFKLELGVSLVCAARPDFAEGVRALIIDKDQQPQWRPATPQLVTQAWGEGFFASPWLAQHHPLNALESAATRGQERKAA